MSVVDEIEKLNGLKQSGAISEQEYEETKASLLARKATVPPSGDRWGAEGLPGAWVRGRASPPPDGMVQIS